MVAGRLREQNGYYQMVLNWKGKDGKRKPNFVTQHFYLLLERNGLKKIRFHDLRHSCASLLYASGVGLKEIQEWLGHSDIGTTSDIYTHLDYNNKVSSANLLLTQFTQIPYDCPKLAISTEP